MKINKLRRVRLFYLHFWDNLIVQKFLELLIKLVYLMNLKGLQDNKGDSVHSKPKIHLSLFQTSYPTKTGIHHFMIGITNTID